MHQNLFNSNRVLNKLKYASDKTLKEKLEIWFIKDHKKGIFLLK
jgi:hypothetical protein